MDNAVVGGSLHYIGVDGLDLEVHHTPKHASWLNMAEIEISVLGRQCLKRRIGLKEVLEKEIAAYVADRNSRGSKILWGFTIPDACIKMKRLYPRKLLWSSTSLDWT